MKTLSCCVLLIFVLISVPGMTQGPPEVRVSPLSLAISRSEKTYIKITYSQPQKKGRDIFGALVPYGKVWRTGANEATEITTTKDILVNNLLLKAGTYSLFTIPNKDKWTIIINGEVGLWGAYNYNQKLDLFRFDVPVQNLKEIQEALTIQFDTRNTVADLSIAWDNIKVSIPVKYLN